MKTLALLWALIFPLSAVTLDVVMVYLPLSLHGTDSAGSEFGGEAVQAGIYPYPMVLSGAFPEILVEATAQPFRLKGTERYQVEECNLFQLCGITLRTELVEGTFVVELDVTEMTVPDEVEFTAETVLKLCMTAIEKTLRSHPIAEGESLPCDLRVVGVGEKNKGLAVLGTKFLLGTE